jgi:hypothetical protein
MLSARILLLTASGLVLGCSSGRVAAGDAGDGTGADAWNGADESADGDGPPADEAACVDLDHDGYCAGVDCDDGDPSIHPGMDEICGNGRDDDCDQTTDEGCQPGAVHVVDKDSLGGLCSDAGPGTLTEPWCTLDKANATLRAGDTLHIRAGTYLESIQPAASGIAEELRIVYQAFGDEQVVMREQVYCIRLQSKAYITVKGLRCLDCGRNLYLDATRHTRIEGCGFDNPSGPATWAGSRIFNGSTHNRISGCTFSRYGNETFYDGSYQDNGCILDIGNDNRPDPSDHNLVEDCTFFHGGHHILGVYASRNLVRRNTFHNEAWYACHRTEIGGLCGNRNVILNTSDPSGNILNVIEHNHIVYAGVPPDQISSAGLSVRTQRNIVRRNITYHCDSSGVALSADGRNTNDASRNYIYHNVFFRNGYPRLDDWPPRQHGLLLARWVNDAAHNPMVGVAIKNNIFAENQRPGIYFYNVDPVAQDVADNFEEPGDPLFVRTSGTAEPFDFQTYDFRLTAESPCIDGGGFLTHAVGAGVHSTALAVQDAGHFSDGHGLVPGDLVQFEGPTTVARVVRVDHATNTLTLHAPRSWTAGAGVAQPYAGARPDQGAFEHPGD